jgi:hypothetical protein
VRLEGLGQLKNPMISSGIEPPTFRHSVSINYATACPFNKSEKVKMAIEKILEFVAFVVPSAVTLKNVLFWEVTCRKGSKAC